MDEPGASNSVTKSPVETDGIDVASSSMESGGERQGETATIEAPSCSRSGAPPPGYMLVTVQLLGQSTPVVIDLPIEVLPCHTFADVCEAALARAPDTPPNDYRMRAYLLLHSQLAVPLQDPHTPARPTLRTFPGATRLRYDILPGTGDDSAAAAAAGVRTARVAPRRQRQRW
ncbi:hypothetical protein Agub_g8011, partial [Astrephomene gubernaculifera]